MIVGARKALVVLYIPDLLMQLNGLFLVDASWLVNINFKKPSRTLLPEDVDYLET